MTACPVAFCGVLNRSNAVFINSLHKKLAQHNTAKVLAAGKFPDPKVLDKAEFSNPKVLGKKFHNRHFKALRNLLSF